MLTWSEISSRCLSPLLSGDVEDVVPTDEGVPVLVLQLAVAVLLRLLQSDVHVAVQAGQHAPRQGLIYCNECLFQLLMYYQLKSLVFFCIFLQHILPCL